MRVLILVNSGRNIMHLLGEKKNRLHLSDKELKQVQDSDSKAKIVYYSGDEAHGAALILSRILHKGCPRTVAEAKKAKLKNYYDKILSYPQNNKEIQELLEVIAKERNLITTYSF